MSDSAQRILRAATIERALEILDSGGNEIVMPVAGDSMQPTLRPGQRIHFERDPDRLRRGDLIVARNPANPRGRLADEARPPLLVHRLLGIVSRSDGSRYLRMRGDARGNLDPRIEPEWVVGRVVAVEDPRGWRTLRSPRARLYGNLVALHDLFWAAVGVVSREIDSLLAKVGVPAILGRGSTAIDRGLLRLAHLACFRVAHARCVEPRADGPALSAADTDQP